MDTLRKWVTTMARNRVALIVLGAVACVAIHGLFNRFAIVPVGDRFSAYRIDRLTGRVTLVTGLDAQTVKSKDRPWMRW